MNFLKLIEILLSTNFLKLIEIHLTEEGSWRQFSAIWQVSGNCRKNWIKDLFNSIVIIVLLSCGSLCGIIFLMLTEKPYNSMKSRMWSIARTLQKHKYKNELLTIMFKNNHL